MLTAISKLGGGFGDGHARWRRERGHRRFLVLATLAIGLSAGASEAQAGWSPAARVLGESHFGYAVVAFDAYNTPWVAWDVAPEEGVAPSGLFVARLTRRYRLASVHRLPGPYLEEIESQPAFAIDAAGCGILAWRYLTEYGVGRQNGAAIAAWRLGNAPSKRVELIAPTSNEVEPVSLATNRHGTTVVMYSELEFPHAEITTRVGRIDAALLRTGKILARQKVATITGGPTANHPQVAPSIAEGFQATWELEGGESEHFAELGADASQASADGVFFPARLTPWPPGRVEVADDRAKLISGARGDQVVWWTTGQENAHSSRSLYVASRRHGEGFSASHLLGQTDHESPDIVINRRGRFTIAWTQPVGKGRTAAWTASGPVGGKVGAPRLLTAGLNLGRLGLVLTQSGEAVAAWSQQRASGEVVAQAATSVDGIRFTKPHTIFREAANSGLACGGPTLWPDRRNGVLAGWTCSTPRQHNDEEFARYQP